MLILLLIMVSVGLVLGATAPITPNGEYSNSTIPPSPVRALVVRSLYARRVFKSGFIFQIFIFFVAHAGFRGALFRQRRQLGGQRLPQGADNGAAGFSGHC